MSKLSRRQFLKQTGAFGLMVGAGVPGLSVTSPTAPEVARGEALLLGTSLGLSDLFEVQGRAFAQTRVYEKPLREAPFIGSLMPDSVQTLMGLGGQGWWYQVADGYVQREALQPMPPYQPPLALRTAGYGEVITPFSAIREYCAGMAPILARVNYGTVLFVHDQINDDRGQTWYAVSPTQASSLFYGWLSAGHVRPLQPAAPVLRAPAVWIDTDAQKLAVYDGDRLVGEAAIYAPPLLSGHGHLDEAVPSTVLPGSSFSRPYVMRLVLVGGTPVQLSGAYWHNRFGTAPHSRSAGGIIELPISAARWLYGLVSRAGSVEVIVD